MLNEIADHYCFVEIKHGEPPPKNICKARALIILEDIHTDEIHVTTALSLTKRLTTLYNRDIGKDFLTRYPENPFAHLRIYYYVNQTRVINPIAEKHRVQRLLADRLLNERTRLAMQRLNTVEPYEYPEHL